MNTVTKQLKYDNYSEKICLSVSCGNIATPGSLTYIVFTDGYTSSSHFTCVPGYTLVGNSTRQCDPTGAWSGEMPSCGEFPWHHIHLFELPPVTLSCLYVKL